MQSYREYFESEMRSLQELAQEFSEAYPEQAAMLNLNSIKDRDPYVERLLEGMAFLTSHIRQRLDDAVPEISQALLEQVMPALIRPYPSTTVVEFQSATSPKETLLLDRGQSVRALNCGPANASCDFVTTQKVRIDPIALTHASNQEKTNGGSVIDLALQKSAEITWESLKLDGLKFYINTDWQLAYSLIHALTDKSTQITVSIPGRSVLRSSAAIRFSLAHLDAHDSILPYTGRSRSAFSVVHDYFCAREKNLFVQLEGLDGIRIPETTNQLAIRIDTGVGLPVDSQISVECLRLNCSPAVNLYAHDAEPILVDHSRSEYRLSPDRQCAEYSTIYSVEAVTSRDLNTGETYDYSPLYAMRHRKQDDRVYHTKQRLTGIDDRLTFLSLNASAPFNPETVSTEVLLSNGQYPRRYIDIGTVSKLSNQYSRQLTARNITRPSRQYGAPVFQDYQWQLVSLLSLNLSSLESIDNIKHLLSLFDWTDQLENKQRIEAIVGVQTKVTHRLKKGVLFQGLEVRIELTEQGFSNISDMYLFGAVLHNFFSAFANMTEFVQTKVVQLPSYKEWTWNPVFGSKAKF